MNKTTTLLPSQELLLAEGEDSEKFLQGQLTCDLASLTQDNFSYGALCNNKGRVICNFIIYRLADTQGFALVMGKGMAEAALSHLNKYAVFFKVAMKTDNALLHYGDTGSVGSIDSPEASTAPFSLTRDQDSTTLILPPVRSDQYRVMIITGQELATGTDKAIAEDWLANCQSEGFVLLEHTLSTRFTPEELNLDWTNAISFTKGCYTGQEIIARMHYRGSAKKRLFHFSAQLPGNYADIAINSDIAVNGTQVETVSMVVTNDRLNGLAVCNSSKVHAENTITVNDQPELPAVLKLSRYAPPN